LAVGLKRLLAVGYLLLAEEAVGRKRLLAEEAVGCWLLAFGEEKNKENF